MTKLNNNTYKNHINTKQIENYLTNIRYFLLGIGFISIYIYIIYLFFFDYSSILNLWFNLTEILLCICFCITQFRFKTKMYFNKNNTIFWIKVICGIIGISLILGLTLLYSDLASYVDKLYYYQSFNLSFIIICISSIFTLTYLNQKYRYFLLLLVPIILSFLYAQLYLTISIENHTLFFLFTDLALLSILIFAGISVQIQNKLTSILYKNNVLIQDTENQILIQNHLNNKIQTEMKKSKDIEFKLYEYSQILKYKNEKTLDLESMHQDLKTKQTNLILAHDIAGLTPWDWNIKERKITLANKSNQTYIHNINPLNANDINQVHPSDLEHFKHQLFNHLRGLSDHFEATYRIQHSDKKWYWVHDIGRVITRNSKNNFALQMIGIRRDIHKERLNQERLKLSAIVLQQAAEGIFVLNEDLIYIDVNPFYEKLTGFHRKQLLGKHIFDIAVNYNVKQQSMHNLIINEILSTGKYNNEITEFFLSGRECILKFHINAIKDEHHRTINYIGIVSDLTEKRLQEQRLSYLENYDTLTDLPNRFYYNYQLHQYLITHQNTIKQLAIIRLNIDRFRPLNEYLSNNGGDELLKQLAQRLRLCNEEALFLAHLNGDNFAIVYELSNIRSSIYQQCERITKQLTLPFQINNEDHVITASMGVSFYPEHGRQIDYLNSYAEQALNEAKRLGGNMTRIYNLQTNAYSEQNIQLERDLRNAIKNNELSVYYQPKIYFNNLKIQGFEALVRWNHPSKGLISPNVFLPIAEQTSLISEIGKFVILKTAEQIQKWKIIGYDNIVISLNIVAQQLHRGNLLEIIDHALERYNISGENLELEITESSLVDKSDLVKKTLNEIKKRNIRIALDDFGTGYSSLSYLANFPINTLKIDRSFVSKIGQPKQEALVNAIIAMGKAMGMSLVAEGVETDAQKQYLFNHQCDIAQGFLFSQVLTAQDATSYLIKNYH